MSDYENMEPSEAIATHKSIVDPPEELKHSKNRSATIRLWNGLVNYDSDQMGVMCAIVRELDKIGIHIEIKDDWNMMDI